MADLVQRAMEGMVPELEDLEKRGLFSKAEIAQIVRARRGFEYSLQRKSPNKGDFLRYIEYEMNLDLLRKKRKTRLNLVKVSRSDFASARRIHHIFERAVYRFGTKDLPLWLQFIRHCEDTKAHRALGKVFPRALQQHPLQPALWARAAAHEFRMQNISSARVLMQRGLRVNSDSALLWTRFFVMELRYVQKLRTRRRLMGLGGDAGDAMYKDMLQGGLPIAIHRNAMSKVALRGDLAVHKAFLEAIPKPTPIRERKDGEAENGGKLFGELERDAGATSRDSPVIGWDDGFSRVRASVLSAIWREFGSTDPAAWRLLAASALRAAERELIAPSASNESRDSNDSRDSERANVLVLMDPARADPSDPCFLETASIACLEQGLLAVPTDAMFETYADFLRKRIDRHASAGDPRAAVGPLARRLLTLCSRARDANAASESVFHLCIDTLVRVGRQVDAEKNAHAATQAHPRSIRLWLCRCDLARSALGPAPSANDPAEKLKIVERLIGEALAVPGNSGSADLWLRLAAERAAAGRTDAAVRVLKRAIEAVSIAVTDAMNEGSGDGSMGLQSIVMALLDTAVAAQSAGKTVNYVLKTGPHITRGGAAMPGLAIHLRCAAALTATSASDSKVKEVYETTVARFGSTEPQCWLSYTRWLLRSGRASEVAKAHWRAIKAMQNVPPEEKRAFEKAYRGLIA